MAEKEAISEIMGRARVADQSSAVVVVYRALRSIRCASCDEVIAEGALFTRHSVFEQGTPILPKCRKCVPFNVQPAEEKARHPMLDSILSPPAGQSSVSQSAPSKRSASGSAQDHLEQERIAEAVRRRLGPALARSRRSKA
jgi:hypothetical protein